MVNYKGIMIKVPATLVKRCKTHMHNLHCGATIILGNNGYIWIGPVMHDMDLSLREVKREIISKMDREAIARLRNCINALAKYGVLLYDTSITFAYEASLKYDIKDLLKPDIQHELVDSTRRNLAQHL